MMGQVRVGPDKDRPSNGEVTVENFRLSAVDRLWVVVWLVSLVTAIVLGLQGCGGNMSLFDDTLEGNIGRSDIAVAAGSPAVAPGGYGPIKGLVKFAATEENEGDPQVVTASVYAMIANGFQAGPITGQILWASGNGLQNVAEFDVPIQTTTGPPIAPQIEPTTGGTQVTVVGTSFEIRARNDANLIPPNINGVGVQLPLGNNAGAELTPVNVSASLAVGGRPTSGRVTRTVWAVNNPANPLAVGNATDVFVPPFASSFRIMRSNTGTFQADAIRFNLGNNAAVVFDGGYDVAAGAPCPEILLSGQEGRIRIFNTGVTVIEKLAVVFFLNL
jgi:hypothetical protein